MPNEPESTVAAEPKEFVKQRLLSLDVYRGLIMISLAFTGFGLAETAARHLEIDPTSSFWHTVKFQFDHTEWVGCSYWDLIQPSFMFMVGVSMAYSYAKRQKLGQSYARMLGHAVWRSIVLILLGIFLISNSSSQTITNWSLMNVLTQIGLGYTFLFLLWGRSFRFQAIAAAVILVGTGALYLSYPNAGIDVQSGAPEVGVSQEWAAEHLAGIPAAWQKNASVGHAIDLVVLNWFPEDPAKGPFTFNNGGYQTINFIPSLATMLFGLMCGELLRSDRRAWKKLLILIGTGVGGLVVGELLHLWGLTPWGIFGPAVKRIWTPSWAIYSTGWCCLILAALYGIIDVAGLRRWWTFPIVVVGMNSIAIYCMAQTLKGWTARTLEKHIGANIYADYHGERLFEMFGAANAPTVEKCLVGLVFWLVCWWMYRHKIFIRI
jgi:predicted acyltransferase